MAKAALKWDETGKRWYTSGVDRGVLFVLKTDGSYDEGVSWSGLTKISESPEGAEVTDQYADNQVYASLISAEKFKGTIEAFYSPEEFDQCDGIAKLANGTKIGQQDRRKFGLAWRVQIGNDVAGMVAGHEIHIAYGCSAQPSSKDRETVNDSPEASTLSWEFSTLPVQVPGYKPTAHIVVRSTEVGDEKFKKLTDALWGKDETSSGAGDGVAPKLPLPHEVDELLK